MVLPSQSTCTLILVMFPSVCSPLQSSISAHTVWDTQQLSCRSCRMPCAGGVQVLLQGKKMVLPCFHRLLELLKQNVFLSMTYCLLSGSKRQNILD